MQRKLKIVVLGGIGRIPFAGVAWEVLQYVEGFRRLGHDVHYIEDSWDWPFNPEKNAICEDNRYTLSYLARVMAWCGLSDRWAYRAVEEDGRIYGLSEAEFKRVFQQADMLVNLSAITELHEEHLDVPVRVCVHTDVGHKEVALAKGERITVDLFRAHTHLFTFAENLGAPDCGLPPQPFDFKPTRNPIVLEWFTPPADWRAPENGWPRGARRLTTVGNWAQTGRDIEWNGEVYTWSKHLEFLKFIGLPKRVGQPIELALASITKKHIRLLKSHGWHVVEAYPLTTDILPYREYIWGSDGEFTVAKDQNVRLRSGWFSDRSACYLAASKPVITQDTGFGRVLPTGEGLFAFNTMEEIVAAFEAIRSDYAKHSRAARAIAEEYFRAEKVLSKMLDAIGI